MKRFGNQRKQTFQKKHDLFFFFNTSFLLLRSPKNISIFIKASGFFVKIAARICHCVGSLKITSVRHYCEKFLQPVSCTWGKVQLSSGCPWISEACTCRLQPQAQAQREQHPFCKKNKNFCCSTAMFETEKRISVR